MNKCRKPDVVLPVHEWVLNTLVPDLGHAHFYMAYPECSCGWKSDTYWISMTNVYSFWLEHAFNMDHTQAVKVAHKKMYMNGITSVATYLTSIGKLDA